MKQSKMFTLLMAMGVTAFISCNNSADTAATNEDSANNMAGTSTTTGDYAAKADEIEKNS